MQARVDHHFIRRQARLFAATWRHFAHSEVFIAHRTADARRAMSQRPPSGALHDESIEGNTSFRLPREEAAAFTPAYRSRGWTRRRWPALASAAAVRRRRRRAARAARHLHARYRAREESPGRAVSTMLPLCFTPNIHYTLAERVLRHSIRRQRLLSQYFSRYRVMGARCSLHGQPIC